VGPFAVAFAVAFVVAFAFAAALKLCSLETYKETLNNEYIIVCVNSLLNRIFSLVFYTINLLVPLSFSEEDTFSNNSQPNPTNFKFYDSPTNKYYNLPINRQYSRSETSPETILKANLHVWPNVLITCALLFLFALVSCNITHNLNIMAYLSLLTNVLKIVFRVSTNLFWIR